MQAESQGQEGPRVLVRVQAEPQERVQLEQEPEGLPTEE